MSPNLLSPDAVEKALFAISHLETCISIMMIKAENLEITLQSGCCGEKPKDSKEFNEIFETLRFFIISNT